MPKTLRLSEKRRSSGLYDSATGDSCRTEKLVEITEDCPVKNEGERVILLFTRAKRGRIVQIRRTYGRDIDESQKIHFFVEELEQEMRAEPRDDTFGSTASELGFTKQALRALIEKHVPA